MTVVPLPVLTDASTPPTEAIIESHLGAAGRLWEAFFASLHEAHADFDEQWRYYSDGRSWLMKVVHRTKTVCWVSVGEGSFRVTAYFPPRAEPLITASALPGDLKAQFLDSTAAHTRGITVTFRGEADVESALELVGLRDDFR